VIVRILHPVAAEGSGPLTTALAAARRRNAARLEARFGKAGAADVRIDEGVPDGRAFGARLRELASTAAAGHGLVVLGSGAIPQARRGDLAALLAVAGSGERRALANSFYSADVVAVGDAANLAFVPDLPSDNALPRWLRDEAGYRVEVMGRRSRLGLDIDSPLDLVLLGLVPPAAASTVDDTTVRARLDEIRAVATDPSRQLVVAGRSSARTLRWLERNTASRTRALIEERGLRAIGLAEDGQSRPQRPARSVLAMLLDDRGPAALGAILAELGDAAVVDTRVLLAHRLGVDEDGWPSPEDRYASDLLLPDAVGDPWLRELTASARDSAIPVLLGGHTLVGPGLRFVVKGR
jgi:hypothetical protein